MRTWPRITALPFCRPRRAVQGTKPRLNRRRSWWNAGCLAGCATAPFFSLAEVNTALAAFMKTVPFQVPLDRPVARLAAGEKQKVEILKQLYLQRRFMILDEPTSVLTPAEADEVLGMLKQMARDRGLFVWVPTVTPPS